MSPETLTTQDDSGEKNDCKVQNTCDMLLLICFTKGDRRLHFHVTGGKS